MQRTIIVVVGMPGSGKSEVSKFCKEQGIPMFRTGDVIRKAVIDGGMALTPENSEMMARKLRERHGMDFAAREVGKRISKLNDSLICVEGPRDMYELEHLASLGRVVLVVVEAPFEARFKRSTSRKGNRLEPRTRDARSVEEFKWRCKKELERGLGEVLKTKKYARHEIRNDGTLEELRKKAKLMLGEIRAGR